MTGVPLDNTKYAPASQTEHDAWPLRAIRDFSVDFWGTLMPGVMFIILVSVPLASSLYTLAKQLGGIPPMDMAAILAALAGGGLGYLGLGIFTSFLMLSYVVGSIFFREDPNVPDGRSARRIVSRMIHRRQAEEVRRWVVQPKAEAATGSGWLEALRAWWRRFRQACGTRLPGWADEVLGCPSAGKMDVEFPYLYLKKYLRDRGMVYLAEKVPWDDDDETRKNRTKNYINVLKARLLFCYPDSCGQIVRNEAHIRLASSSWFAARTTARTCLLCVGLIALAGVRAWRTDPDSLALAVTIPAVACLAVTVVASHIQRKVEYFIHYQRVREAVWVLETAWTADRHLQQSGCPCFSLFEELT